MSATNTEEMKFYQRNYRRTGKGGTKKPYLVQLSYVGIINCAADERFAQGYNEQINLKETEECL